MRGTNDVIGRDLDELLAACSRGEDRRQLADQYDISEFTIIRLVKRHGLDTYIDEVAIDRTFAGDRAVGSRLTIAERHEVYRRAWIRWQREEELNARLLAPFFEFQWMDRLSEALGYEVVDHRGVRNKQLRNTIRMRVQRGRIAS